MSDAAPARRPGIPFFVAVGALALLVGMHLAVLAGDGLLYIAHGRLILEQGALPDVDPFSLTSVRAPLVLHMLLPMIFPKRGKTNEGRQADRHRQKANSRHLSASAKGGCRPTDTDRLLKVCRSVGPPCPDKG